MDTIVYKFINGLAGDFPFLGHAFGRIANDYFLPVIVFLIFVAMWFGTRDPQRRAVNQRAVLISLIAVGMANAFVIITTVFVIRERPFMVLPPDQVHLFYYAPHDSSFPSNYASILFAAAISMFPSNRRAATIIFIIAVLGAFGRVFIGIHYPSDVLAGVAYGIAASLTAWGIGWLFNPILMWLLRVARKFYFA